MKFDKFYLWFMRIANLPLAVACFYVVRRVLSKLLAGTAMGDEIIAFVVFGVGGTYCLAAFIVSWMTAALEGSGK